MKRIISLVLALVLCVCVVSGMCSVSALDNYSSVFEEEIGSLWFTLLFTNPSFDLTTPGVHQIMPQHIIDFATTKFDLEDYQTKTENGEYGYIYYYSVPEDVLESKVEKSFKFEKSDLHISAELSPGFSVEYKADTKTYDFVAEEGGFGGGGTYSFYGYHKPNQQGNYTVYGYYLERGYSEIEPGWVLGKDYLEDDGAYSKINGAHKTEISYDGKHVTFLRWENIAVSDLPKANTLITAKDPVSSTPSVESKPIKPQSSTPASSGDESSSSNPVSSLLAETSSKNSSSSDSSDGLKTVAQAEGLVIKTESDVFPADTIVVVETIRDGNSYTAIETALKETAEKFVAYEITATSSDVSVQPNGSVKAVFDIPKGFNIANTVVLYLSADGKIETLKSVIDDKENTITAELTHFSTYVVAEKKVDESVNNQPAPKNNGTLVWTIVIILIVLAGGAAAMYFLVIKKKK